MRTRLVLDTNTVVSGFLWDSAPRKLIDALVEGTIEAFSSPALITELTGVLQRTKFAKRLADPHLSPTLLIERYRTLAQIVEPAIISRTVPTDPDDDQVLACALAARVDLIVSGDKQLRNLKRFHRIEIVSAAEALVRITQHSANDNE